MLSQATAAKGVWNGVIYGFIYGQLNNTDNLLLL